MVPSTQLTLYYLGTYKNPPGVWADLVDGQVEIVGKLTVQLRQWQAQPSSEQSIIHAHVCRLTLVTLLKLLW